MDFAACNCNLDLQWYELCKILTSVIPARTSLEILCTWGIKRHFLQEWHKAVSCFLFEFWEDLTLHQLESPVPIPPPWFQAWCANLAQNSRICFLRGNTGDNLVDGLLPHLPALGAKRSDVMVLNFAIWFNTYAASLQALPCLVKLRSMMTHQAITRLCWIWTDDITNQPLINPHAFLAINKVMVFSSWDCTLS